MKPMRKILFAGQIDKGPFGEAGRWCKTLGMEVRFFYPGYTFALPMRARRYRARFGDDVDYRAVALEYIMHRRQFGRARYLNLDGFFFNRLRRIAAKAEKLLENFRPDALVLYHGGGLVVQILLAKAVKKNIPALFFETPILPGGSFILDRFAPFFSSGGFSELEQGWPPAPLSAQAEQRAENFVAAWQARRASKFYVADDPVAEKRLGEFLRPNKKQDKKPVALFALQVPTDMNVSFSLPDAFGANYRAWVNAMLAAAPPDWKFIIRPHPKSDFIPNLPDHDRFLILPELNLHRVMDAADSIITLASNVGMEAMLAGKPAIVSDKVFYARKGLTLDCPHPARLPALLAASRKFSVPAGIRRRFVHQALLAYHFFPGEEEKLRARLASAVVPVKQEIAPLFHLLPAQHKAAYHFMHHYEHYRRSEKMPHLRALQAARAATPQFLWQDEFNAPAQEIFRAYWRRRFLVWRRFWSWPRKFVKAATARMNDA